MKVTKEELKDCVRVYLTYEQAHIYYRTQEDADKDKDGSHPELVVAMFCCETGRELELPSKNPMEHRDVSLCDID